MFTQNAKFMEGVSGVTQVTSQPRLSQVQKKCQKMAGWGSSGFPGSQPVSMDIKNLKNLTTTKYKVSWKADGTRSVHQGCRVSLQSGLDWSQMGQIRDFSDQISVHFCSRSQMY